MSAFPAITNAKETTFGKLVATVSTNNKKVQKREYLESGQFPVVDQGQQFIGGYCDDESKVISEDLPLLVFGDHTRTFKYLDQPFVPGADGVKVLKPLGVNAKWLYHIAHALDFPDKGYARHFQHLKNAKLRVPPLQDQRCIVEEIERRFSHLEVGVAALHRVQANLKRYRAAVLKAACEGRLVRGRGDWAELPLKKLIGKIGQGWSPKCDTSRDPSPGEWSVITTTAVQPMKYVDGQGKPLPNDLEPRPHLEIRPGDFLMTRKGPRKRAGVTCLVHATMQHLMVCDTVYRFRCNESLVEPRYLEVALNSPDVAKAIDRQKAGISESGVSLTHGKLGVVPIPVPSLTEQREIVAEVERRLSVIEKLDTAVAANLQRAVRLRQSILQRAFGDPVRLNSK